MENNKVEQIIPNSKSTNKKPKRTKNIILYIIVIIALAISITSLILFFIEHNRTDTPIAISQTAGVDGNSANFAEGSIADVANSVSPSVVSILSSVRSTDYFGRDTVAESAGTGMIVSSDGYILTNKHVVDGTNSVTVILDNGTTYENVSVVATDPLNDVAFLKIDGVSDLPAVTLGDSKTINVGQQVIAIGNALGQFQNTVTSGIISGVGRSITATDSTYSSSEDLVDMIQTDAAINSGNSGGPLVNAAGQVIGINTAVSADGQGLGFAIPISSVKGMLKSVIETGSAGRAYIGIRYINITPDIAKENNLPASAGAYVYYSKNTSAIIKNSPAEKAGVKDGDIITAISGVEIGRVGSLSSLIGEYMVGDTIQLTILRDGETIAINVTLEAYQE